ncbi:MAG: ATP-binding protein [Planctomicrobium sp.]|nr:ATP-binding protein [Planctomicrobium sp.]
MFDYEKLGAFYLGKEYDVEQSELRSDYVMYDAKDLTTHAVIVGMTGSGKTGLGITLLEEAAIDGIPSLIIDPKGDMGNLLLNFPNLKAKDFLPWVEQGDAARKGMTIDEYAADRAELWKDGLQEWEQKPDRIQKLKDAAEVAIYTPGSDSGIPLTILKSLNAPPPQVIQSSDAMRERVSTAVSGLLTLLGIDPDPLRSPEHILLSNILDYAWREGRDLDMPALIGEIQSPPFEKIGIMDLETIFPASSRLKLAMTVNNVLASPAFSTWTQGEPLNIQKLLYTDEGKPRLAVISIAHLNDQERMFFVTLLLNEVVSWMRTQTGTSSLRALLYMDEVFGYLPPTANPPSKIPLLTLLKQARAYGLGLILATQNPVDLDYKALSNAGTWFLGRLQTERDKLRVLDGLEGASTTAGVRFDRKRVEKILSAVGSRVFMMNNIHESQPVIFHTRWVLSYLSGPMTREQISTLMQPLKQLRLEQGHQPHSFRPELNANEQQTLELPEENSQFIPVLPEGIEQKFVAISRSTPREAVILYRPSVTGNGVLHFVDAKSSVDIWQDQCFMLEFAEDSDVGRDPWADAEKVEQDHFSLESQPFSRAHYAGIPKECTKKTSWRSWNSSLKNFLYREQRLTLSTCSALKKYSHPDDREGDFLAEIRQAARERRDLEVTKLRKKYESKFETLSDRTRKAEARVAKEREQANSATVSAAVSIGTSILGALFGRKKLSSANVSRAGSSMRSASRAADQRSDIQRAEAEVEELQQDVKDLEAELEEALKEITESYSDDRVQIEPYEIKPRKSDIEIDSLLLVWLPYQIDDNGIVEPAFDE